jgi:TolB protein
MKRIVWIMGAAAATLAALLAQQSDFYGVITHDAALPALAVPDFRGDGAAQSFMAVFNKTLWSDLDGAGIFNMVSKGNYPLTVPQQLSDFKIPPPVQNTPLRRGQAPPPPPTGGGLWLSDWLNPPTQARYVTVGYTAVQNSLLVLRGWLVDLTIPDPSNAGALAKTYVESLDEGGARKAAHEFACDILQKFGSTCLFGSHIYFVRRTGTLKAPVSEIWGMDPDGGNQKQITHFNALSDFPAVSPDGSKVAFTSWVHGNPGIFVFSVDPVRDLRFYNQRGASVTASPSFTPDGKQIVFQSSVGGCCGIYIANLDGSGVHSITSARSIDAEPKVNPKTGAEIAFSSGRSGPEQIYRMSIDGTDAERLTDGTGEASNPSWHPNGDFLAYAWTRGYMAGAFNIFVMNVATRAYQQLTHDAGKNENPSWAPDGKHIVFMSDRTGRPQIWSMLADGSQQQQLTREGSNLRPVWGK